MNELYDESLKFVLGSEGGYSNHPLDNGGSTMMGITQGALNKAFKQGIVKHNNVRKLTRKEAADIYEANYWRPSHACDLSWPMCALHFDAAVNHGVGGAGKLLQRTINKLSDAKLTIDGAVGPATMAAIRKMKLDNKFCSEYCNQRELLYDAIVRKNPSQKVFLRGWMNRLRKNRILAGERVA